MKWGADCNEMEISMTTIWLKASSESRVLPYFEAEDFISKMSNMSVVLQLEYLDLNGKRPGRFWIICLCISARRIGTFNLFVF